MSRPKQVVPLLVAAALLWLLHVILVVTAPAGGAAVMGEPYLASEPTSLLIAMALANLTFWLGLLLISAALLLLVLAWERRWREDGRSQPSSVDHYA